MSKYLPKLIVLLASLAIILLLLILLYRLLSPEITVHNQSEISISEVIIQLPSNQISFSSIPSQTRATIYYSWDQAEGYYQYQLIMHNQLELSGTCGTVTNNQFFKKLTLNLSAAMQLTCEESSKLF